MKRVFKIISFLCIFMFISNISAYSFDEGKDISNNYINNNRKNIAYLINTSKIPFGYNNKTISYVNGFNTGGLINIYEVNTSKIDDFSYLVTSLPYFSIDGKVINDESSTDSNIKVTEYIKKEVKIIGNGTYKDPWKFVPYNLLEVSSSDENKGTISPAYAFVYDGGDAIFTVTPKTGYKYYNSTCENIIVNNDKITFKNINKDEKCIINFIENKVKLTYDNNGGSGCSSKDVSYGLNYGDLCTPVKNKYIFMGWYTSLNGGEKVDTNTKVTNSTNHTLYAHWKSTFESLCTGETLANCLKDNYEFASLTKIEQTVAGNQNYDTTEYRYQGKTPDNYISFNGETGVWRIIGVFEVETPNGTNYTKEYKVKIVRDAIGKAAWNRKTSSLYRNDWETATLMTMLNNGPYYNRTKGYTELACSIGYKTAVSETALCNYENNGLTDVAKNQISMTKWYLGSVVWTDSVGFGNTKEIYTEERGPNVWAKYNHSQIWDGKVALIYPSDYMYASSKCYNDETMKGNNKAEKGKDYKNDKCKSTNWLLDTSNRYWTVSNCSTDLISDISIFDTGSVGSYGFMGSTEGGLRPSIYLNTNIKYKGGEGNISNPFTIE